MGSSKENILVFGPTGAIGRSVALTVHRPTTHVWLAMRNPEKPIPGISNPAEGFTRIQADLSDPQSLASAVQTAQAKTAFVYVLPDSTDAMHAAFTARRDAGIAYVVLLSSWLVKGDAAAPHNHSDWIARTHAAAEVSLRSLGVRFAAVRPAYFNSNFFMIYSDGLARREIVLMYPDAYLDFIAPEDVGAACGAIALDPPQENPEEIVYLCGPKLMRHREAIGVVSKVLGRDIAVKEVSEEAWRAAVKGHIPQGIVDSVADELRLNVEKDAGHPPQLYEQAVKNLVKWKGGKPMSLEDWVELHRGEFEALMGK